MDNRLPPLEPLRGFEAAARHLSFTKAGEELHLSQSAVSRQVQALEDSLGVALFQRLPRKLALTPEGEALLFTVREIFRQLEQTTELLRAERRRPVTITTTIGVAALWLVPRLSLFLADHPEVDVRISANNRMVDLARDGIDLALRYGPPDSMPHGSPRLFGDEMFPVGAPATVGELAQRPLRAEDLPRITLLDYDDPSRDPWMGWDRWLDALGLASAKPKGVLHFNHYDQLIAAAMAGQGLAIGRRVLVRSELESGRLVQLQGITPYLSQRAYYLIKAQPNARPEVGWVRDWLLAQARLEPGSG